MKTFTRKAFVIASLRRCTFRWPARNAAMQKARVKQIRVGNRLVWHYNCVMCEPTTLHTAKNIRVDHIVPVVDPMAGFPMMPDGKENWTVYIERMFCNEEGFQILCLRHHEGKTLEESRIRQAARQIRKNVVIVKKKRKSKHGMAKRSKRQQT